MRRSNTQRCSAAGHRSLRQPRAANGQIPAQWRAKGQLGGRSEGARWHPRRLPSVVVSVDAFTRRGVVAEGRDGRVNQVRRFIGQPLPFLVRDRRARRRGPSDQRPVTDNASRPARRVPRAAAVFVLCPRGRSSVIAMPYLLNRQRASGACLFIPNFAIVFDRSVSGDNIRARRAELPDETLRAFRVRSAQQQDLRHQGVTLGVGHRGVGLE